MSDEEMTFEQKLEKVKALADAIESGTMPLEEAVKSYEVGINTLNRLEKELNEMKRKITVIRDATDSGYKEESFGEENNENV